MRSGSPFGHWRGGGGAIGGHGLFPLPQPIEHLAQQQLRARASPPTGRDGASATTRRTSATPRSVSNSASSCSAAPSRPRTSASCGTPLPAARVGQALPRREAARGVVEVLHLHLADALEEVRVCRDIAPTGARARRARGPVAARTRSRSNAVGTGPRRPPVARAPRWLACRAGRRPCRLRAAATGSGESWPPSARCRRRYL